MVLLQEIISFRGHPAVRATHRTTFELTRETHLTESGDCIIGVAASKACYQLDERVRQLLRSNHSTVDLVVQVGVHSFTARASGSGALELAHEEELVVRKSSFTSPRTLAILCNRAAIDIPRVMIRELRNPETVGTLKIMVNGHKDGGRPALGLESKS